ncbi:nuclear transport factor 2 family protein [Parvibaculum sp.]|jgi:ketosteroid isomerase-like protein|uniref:nuclear transport factor 2 family protein n=1 Tax=Parvibaculum sp. TaxID=2024848 RepID=UPI001B060C73|nr:nuclear transport factor 2 family protein [Parvibaculum sp.]MBO6634000.1 nuclear transport factor 2 family protein [Parvibaculum sp.]MBO6680056.1 nuclear transport factor 2 family protein [Parvibaculum sp.]MBO6683615.1 nuclear transport factor 2 family protein [Parvibaculum sp.]MBO6904408.1 nuclear transport factor 2 family protein [Parvibaculum sp.]
MSGDIVLDTRTGERGSFADWVKAFDDNWAAPRENLERILGLLSEDVVLKAPTRPPMSRGRAAGRRAFQAAFAGFPDLTGKTKRWAASGEVLFIEMTFTATVGGRKLSWDNIDRFLFRNGEAIERIAFFQDSTIVFRTARRNPRGWLQLVRLSLGK